MGPARRQPLRERIGIALQEVGLDDDFTVREPVRLYPRRLDVDEGSTGRPGGEGSCPRQGALRRAAPPAAPYGTQRHGPFRLPADVAITEVPMVAGDLAPQGATGR